jgi:anaerobic dimethyl sulfoxide reductase subunit B (iron-sulfur subunit)
MCLQACPYDVPQFGAEPDAKMEKCDLCLERWGEDKKPICVQACPMRALDAGPLDELESKYGSTRDVVGFAYSEAAKPSIVFKAKE